MSVALPFACSWSGGKDSCFALVKAIEQGAIPKVLLNMMNEDGKRSRAHGLPASILQQQASAMNIPILTVASGWNDYEHHFISALEKMKQQYGIQAMVFGDIDLQEHRQWEESVCTKAALCALLPLWKQPRKALLLEMLQYGIKSMIVSCNNRMGEKFLGRMLDYALIPELESIGVDVCGEGGEFHTIVLECPLFSKPVYIPPYTTFQESDYHYLQFSDHTGTINTDVVPLLHSM